MVYSGEIRQFISGCLIFSVIYIVRSKAEESRFEKRRVK